MAQTDNSLMKLPTNGSFDADEMRFERKFCVGDIHARHVESLVRLHPHMFVSEYPGRWVKQDHVEK